MNRKQQGQLRTTTFYSVRASSPAHGVSAAELGREIKSVFTVVQVVINKNILHERI